MIPIKKEYYKIRYGPDYGRPEKENIIGFIRPKNLSLIAPSGPVA